MLQNLKLWISSGESLSVSLAEQFLSIFSEHRLCNFYGSTEVMGDVTFHVINSKEDVAVMGKVPIGNVCLIILIKKNIWCHWMITAASCSEAKFITIGLRGVKGLPLKRPDTEMSG